jgi:M6 family metalloprotease-like protein
VAKNLHGRNHRIALQWKVDGGGTAYLGDRNMTLITFPTPGPDMTIPFDNLKPVTGDRPLLVICWDPKRPEHPAPDINDVKNLIFGPTPSVRDYFVVNSHNRMHLLDVGMKGWYTAKKNWAHYWAAADPTDSDGDGWTSGHVEKWAEAIREADMNFDYKQFDTNNDGELTADELGVLIVIPQNSPFGTNRIALGKQYPTDQPLVVDNVKITWIAEAYIGNPLNFGVVAHELCHLFLNLPDMYYSFFLPYAAGAYSLMDISYTDAHIDPFHKIRLGWIQPPMILNTGVYPFDAVETSHVAFILHDPGYGSQEYFIIENRHSNLAYDTNLPDQGLAIWHIMEDPDIYENLTAPPGVDPNNWATIGAGDWGRRAIRMIRPVYGPPFDNRTALWDGSDPVTGYDLLSNDANPNHATLKWHNGIPTGFSIRNISPAGQHMEALVEVPWQPVAVEATPTFTMPLEFCLDQNYPNPFNPETTISFFMDENSQVTFKIFNVLGQEVNVLLNQNLSMGRHTIRWDGRDISGTKVPSGIYFYQLKTAKKEAVKKMILIP